MGKNWLDGIYNTYQKVAFSFRIPGRIGIVGIYLISYYCQGLRLKAKKGKLTYFHLNFVTNLLGKISKGGLTGFLGYGRNLGRNFIGTLLKVNLCS